MSIDPPLGCDLVSAPAIATNSTFKKRDECAVMSLHDVCYSVPIKGGKGPKSRQVIHNVSLAFGNPAKGEMVCKSLYMIPLQHYIFNCSNDLDCDHGAIWRRQDNLIEHLVTTCEWCADRTSLHQRCHCHTEPDQALDRLCPPTG